MTVFVTPSGNPKIDGLLSGYGNYSANPAGTPASITYSFMSSPPTGANALPDGSAESNGWHALSASQQTLFQQALAEISAVANISFSLVPDSSVVNIRVGTDFQPSTEGLTWPASYPGVTSSHIEIANNHTLTSGSFLEIAFHELGNATGLFDTGFFDDPTFYTGSQTSAFGTVLPSSDNYVNYTVMAYKQIEPDGVYFGSVDGYLPQTPMLLDISAWQYLYGANQNGYTPSASSMTESHIGSNHTYSFVSDTDPVTIWIGANVSGANCFDFSACAGKVLIDLTAGSFSATCYAPANITSTYYGVKYDISNLPYNNVAIACNTEVQIAVGNNAGDNLFADSSAGHANLLFGGTGNDSFTMGGGYDVLIGKGGSDSVTFHAIAADYTVTTISSGAAAGEILVAPKVAGIADGVAVLSGITNLVFSDQTISEAGAGASVTARTGLAIADTSANLLANLDSVETLVSAGYVSSITLTDTLLASLTVSPAQLSDGTALAAIVGSPVITVDTLTANLTLTGLTGNATMMDFSGAAGSYVIAANGSGAVTVTSSTGTVDTLTDFTALQFSDHTVIVASTTPAVPGGVSSAEVSNLYGAVFARTPDVAGLAFYEKFAAANPAAGMVNYAVWFLSSPEYTGNTAHNYAQTTAGETQFITDTYANLLHRAPDAGAVDFYESKVITPMLAGLTPSTNAYANADLQAHAQMLTYFANSAEFLSDVTITAQHLPDAQHWLVLI